MKRSVFLLIGVLLLTVACQESFKYEPAPTRPSGKLNTNIVDFLKSRPDAFSLLTQAIERAGLTATLSGGTYTLFAPDDTAFRTFLGTRKLEDIPVADLRNTLLLHVLNQKVLSADLTLDIVAFPSQLAGRSLNLNRNPTFVVTVNGNRVYVSNLEPTNGAIHVIPAVLR